MVVASIYVDSMPMAFDLKDGPEFIEKPAAQVLDHLNSRKMELIWAEPASLRVVVDGRQMAVETSGPDARRLPIRRTFFRKLLRWYHIPDNPFLHMEAATVSAVMNDVLKLIRNQVRIKIEDGDALTITSERYADIDDRDVLLACEKLGVKTVTRTDEFTRMFFEERLRTEPIVGDPCGLGFNVLNSETGFMALRVQGYILRYACTNGAVVGNPIAGSHEGLIHYNVSRARLFEYLKSGVDSMVEQFPRIREMLGRSTRTKLPRMEKVRWRLDGILGGSGGKAFLDAFDAGDRPRLYDLFNYITDRAKQHSALTRFRLEEYAGSLLIEQALKN